MPLLFRALAVLATTFASVAVGVAQERLKLPLVGYIGPATPETNIGTQIFLRRMTALGHVEGKTVSYVLRGWGNNPQNIPDILNDIIGKQINVIVAAGGSAAALAAQSKTRTIPIVFGSVDDPIGQGLVASLAKPGGNITGIANMNSDLIGKQFQLIREVLPTTRTTAILRTGNASNPAMTTQLESAAGMLGFSVRFIDIQNIGEIENKLSEITPSDGVLILNDPLFIANRELIGRLTHQLNIPSFCMVKQLVESGCLLSYGFSLNDNYNQAAELVDAVLRGAPPAELPVRQPTKFELVINLRVAKELGLTIPQTLLVAADELRE